VAQVVGSGFKPQYHKKKKSGRKEGGREEGRERGREKVREGGRGGNREKQKALPRGKYAESRRWE
jgi:hypothetical protein